jgi:hypothetical protein
MGFSRADTYSQPEKFGLEIVGDISWDNEPYQYDYTVVWKDPKTGELFYADDSGCSCPSPFETYTSRDQLTPLSGFQEFYEEMKARENTIMLNAREYNREEKEHVPGAVAELLHKVKVALAG